MLPMFYMLSFCIFQHILCVKPQTPLYKPTISNACEYVANSHTNTVAYESKSVCYDSWGTKYKELKVALAVRCDL